MCELLSFQHVFVWIGAAVVSVWAMTIVWLAIKALAYTYETRPFSKQQLLRNRR